LSDTRGRALRLTGRIASGLLVSCIALVVALLLAEGGLRLAGFEYHLSPTVQVGWPDPETIRTNYVDDPDLFWVTRDYAEKLRVARRDHPQIVFMGDSCTEFGHYPERTIDALKARGSSMRTGIHVAAGGWTSEQGLAQLSRDVLRLRPRVIVVYYGWNDHWRALGPTDHALRMARRFLWLADWSRLGQLVLKAAVGVSAQKDPPPRVPPSQYLANLEEIARLARSKGTFTVFVTAPSNHVAGHEPEYLLKRHVARLSDVIPLHQQYVALTRQAARESGAYLCDAAAAFAELSPQLRAEAFRSDGIHFTDSGDARLGEVVSRCVADALR